MDRFSILVATAALALLSACSPASESANKAPPAITAEFVQQHTKVIYDPYTKGQYIRGPRLGGTFLAGYYLTHSRDIGDEIAVTYTAYRWAFLASAHDISGKRLAVPIEPDRQVESDGTINEFLSISLPEGYLATHANSGIDIRVDGSRGFAFVKFPPAYIQGFLAAVAMEESH
jgi:hypothetical protein